MNFNGNKAVEDDGFTNLAVSIGKLGSIYKLEVKFNNCPQLTDKSIAELGKSIDSLANKALR